MGRAAVSNDNTTPLSAKARDWHEGRRLRALELLAEGYRPSEIARVLGVTPGAVSQWSKRARVGGAAALLKKKRQGRGPRLSAAQLAELRLVLAERAGGHVWTARQVAVVVREKWGIQYSRAHVSRILKALGVSAVARRSLPAQLTSA